MIAFGSRPTSADLDLGLPTLYEELVEVLRISLENDSPERRNQFVQDTITAGASRQHAKEAYRLGYTVSQLIHSYGCICQGITEFAHETDSRITAAEFSQLNLCLDVAIAQAVSVFETLRDENKQREEDIRLGSLIHELRNSLSSAIMAYELIKSGSVASHGATSTVLSNSHNAMRTLIDRAVAEVRMNGQPSIETEVLQVFALLSEVESSCMPEANAKKVSMTVSADPELRINADHHLMASAISNLLLNAIKFTKQDGTVTLRASLEDTAVLIEIEDQGGGMDEIMLVRLFKPFVRDAKSEGLGLGLTIARRAVELNGGDLSARNIPGNGCVFTIRLKALPKSVTA